jgi:hypothetical protein
MTLVPSSHVNRATSPVAGLLDWMISVNRWRSSVSVVGAMVQVALVGPVTWQESGSVPVSEVICQADGPLMTIVAWPPLVAPGC